MGALSMAGMALIIIVVLWFRGAMGRIGLVLAVLAGAALGGLDPVANTVWSATQSIGQFATSVGTYADQPDWGAEKTEAVG